MEKQTDKEAPDNQQSAIEDLTVDEAKEAELKGGYIRPGYEFAKQIKA
jgi:hypothetical protein